MGVAARSSRDAGCASSRCLLWRWISSVVYDSYISFTLLVPCSGHTSRLPRILRSMLGARDRRWFLSLLSIPGDAYGSSALVSICLTQIEAKLYPIGRRDESKLGFCPFGNSDQVCSMRTTKLSKVLQYYLISRLQRRQYYLLYLRVAASASCQGDPASL